ncbi:MAG: antA/AntB antirepressor family protein [Zoogloeaceae bacterium]|jgi:phage anti-repressor protein/phage antirepressor YoqD-like protein|nr:antA/AntB antirepressor family protein [Zoogloeaceae bacterium]
MATIATSTGASAPIRYTIQRLGESRRNLGNPEKISLDITAVSDTGGASLFILDKPPMPLRVGDILLRQPDGLFAESAPGVNLFSQKESSMNLPNLPASLDLAQSEQLIPISIRPIDGEETQSVNARELHAFLEVKKDFSDWIKAQLEIFVKGADYEVFTQKGENPSGGRPLIEYALTMDCAKHVSMMSRTDKGMEARNYFLECERRAKSPVPALPNFTDPAVAAIAWAEQYKAKQKAESALAEAAPKVAALSRIEAGEKSLTFTEAAKVLGMKRDALTRRLHADGWIYRQNKSWVAHSAAIRAGRLEYKEARFTNADTGKEEARPYCHLTPKGLIQFAEIIGVDQGSRFELSA